MVADMYEFDLQTYIWTKIEPNPDEEVPGPRYFHSADACKLPNRSLPFGQGRPLPQQTFTVSEITFPIRPADPYPLVLY